MHPIILLSAGLALAGRAVFKARRKPSEDQEASAPADAGDADSADALDGEEAQLSPGETPAPKTEDSAAPPGANQDAIQAAEVHHEFAVATASLGSITVATLLLQPPVSLVLTIAGVTGVFYNFGTLLKKSKTALIDEKRVSIEVVDSMAVAGLLVTSHFFLCALAEWVYNTGQRLVVQAKAKSRQRYASIFSELPEVVWVVEDGVEVEASLESLKTGDVVVVIAGGFIPADGTITEGVALVDQHLLTGESQPTEKVAGDQVFASTVVLSGRIHISVSESGNDTVLAKIDEILKQTTDFKSSVQLRGETVAEQATVPTLALSGVALLTGGAGSAIAMLNSYVGDDMTIVGPISTLNFLSIASRNGILVKDGRALEALSKVDTVIFDKTGTLTRLQPHVEGIHALNGFEENQLLRYAATAESRQAHPIAKAIAQEALQRGISLPDIGHVDYELGYGVRMNLPPNLVRVGSARFVEMEGVPITAEAKKIFSGAQKKGNSLVMVAVDSQLAGAIELQPTVRPEVKEIIRRLRQRNLSIHIISGDHETTTRTLAEELGVDSYVAEVLPEDKAEIAKQLKAEGKVICFVGDGINDSIALKEAHVSVSLRGASTIATDTAQIILMDGDLQRLSHLFDLSHELKTNLNTSFATALAPAALSAGGVIFLGLGLAGTTLLYVTGLTGSLVNSMLPLMKHRNKIPDETALQPVTPAN